MFTDYVIILLRYLIAEINQDKEYQDHGTFHTDQCVCKDCKNMLEWYDLAWWKKLIAKICL